MYIDDKTAQKVLLKDLISRMLVGLEGSHTHRLTSDEVKEVLDSVQFSDEEEVSALLDAMFTYYLKSQEP
jgi:hypothetical protein